MLLIEKVVKLLDDFHFDIFREHVKNISIRSYYPLALIDVISRDINKEQDSERLFRDTYGEDDVSEKAMKKFFQLAHYTFKLTNYLAKNYPDYLQHNITRIQHHINTGRLDKATQLANVLLDVCEKIEDFDTEQKVLNILIQREVLLESAKQTKKYHERIKEILLLKQDLNDIFFHLHTHFRAKGKPPEGMDIRPHLDFFHKYSKSESTAIKIISRFCGLFAQYYMKDESFYTEKSFQELVDLEKELEKYDYILFPYLFVIDHRIDLLKLNYRLRELNSDKILEEANKIIEDSSDVLFWNSFINLPEIFSIAVQTSHYLSHHMTSYRDDHIDQQEEEITEEIQKLKGRCQSFLDNKLLEEQYKLRYINISYMYAGLLLLGTKEEIKQSIDLLESVLTSYQQVPFHPVIDSIYTILILAHFSLKDYSKVGDTFNRYKKATRGKAVNPENDLVINGFYYISKWVETQRDQYVKKLSIIIKQTDKPNLESTQKLLIEASEYFKLPFPLLKFR